MIKIAEGRIAPDHPALAGHFPGNPIVPGVLLLGEVLSAIERRLGHASDELSWPVVKFMAPLRPNEPFAISIRREGRCDVAFAVTSDGMTIATGRVQSHFPFAVHVAS